MMLYETKKAYKINDFQSQIVSCDVLYNYQKRRGERSREGEREKAAKERKVEGYRDE